MRSEALHCCTADRTDTQQRNISELHFIIHSPITSLTLMTVVKETGSFSPVCVVLKDIKRCGGGARKV